VWLTSFGVSSVEVVTSYSPVAPRCLTLSSYTTAANCAPGVKSVIYDCACKNAAYCYRCSVGGLCLRARLCLYLSAVLERLNRDRDAVWDVNSGGPSEPLGWGPDPLSSGRDNFGGAPMRCCFSSKFYDHLLQYIGWQWRNSSNIYASWFSPPSCG